MTVGSLSTVHGAWSAAHALVPHARHQERDQLLELAQVEDHHRVLDVPAWGGYVTEDLPDQSRVTLVDGAGMLGVLRDRGRQAAGARILSGTISRIPLRGGTVDRVVSAVGLHHLSDLPEALAELARVLAPGGVVSLCDVMPGLLGTFLDRVITQHARCHAGIYRDLDAFSRSARRVGLEPIAAVVRDDLSWSFPDREAMGAYVQHVLVLPGAEVPDVIDALARSLPVREDASGIHLTWPLGFFAARRPGR